ncbi:GlxA family transcriptional regulator [Reinekea blandensis]|uniref:Putative transcriptional regulator protein n=1 Tax=Reinekea blandensis MED297 TaxID=314283 RepID=A4BCS6_9GAMM|nr:helix-turn-helix domain-containing protein [Reinekea blandensis]EAR10008.1 putative transcriptional regulator protein [Reinekea sp. MED297] [Reinekea blandensis MED297]
MTINLQLWHYQGALPAAIAGTEDLFRLANRFTAGPGFELQVVDPSGASSLPHAQVVILPPFIDDRWEQADAQVIARLQALQGTGTLIAACCASVFWLAEAGLLTGRTVTTHWALFDRLRQFPGIKTVDQRNLVVDQGDIVTGGGLFAFQDLVLHLVSRFDRYATAKRIADFAMIDLSSRLQSHYQRFYPDYSHGDAQVLAAQRLCEQQTEQAWSVSRLADAVALSERTLARRFQQALNLSPGEYLRQWRIEQAKQRLENTRQSIEAIAADVGYSDVSNFVRAFRQNAGLSPAEFRDRKRPSHLADG